MDEPAEATELKAFSKGLGSRVFTALFWALLAFTLLIHFSQFTPKVFGTVLWHSWDPAGHGFEAAHVGAAGWLTVLWYLHKRPTMPRWIIAVALLIAFAYVAYYFHTRQLELLFRPNLGTIPDMALGMLLFGMAVYLSWVHWGPIFPLLGALFLAYVFIADVLPGAFKGPSLGSVTIFTRVPQILLAQQRPGIIILASSFLWLLIFWGLLMSAVGVSVAILGLARLLSRAGVPGGPAIGAMFASAITGSFVGGGPANVAVTGPVTIPAMKKAGYTSEQAGAVEAIASNASSITPPVLGAVAFIMADIVGVNYIEIIVMSLVPAFLWFLAAGVYIFAHAQRHRDVIKRVHELEVDEERIPWHTYLRSALLLIIPVSVILVMVTQGNTLRLGATYAFLTTLVLGVSLRIETRWAVWSEGIKRAAFYASSVTIILIIVSVIADAVTFTGLGGRLGGIIEDVSRGELLIAGAIMVAFGVILGAGLPALAIYFIMAVTFAPVLSRMGVDHQISHYTAFYMGNLSTIIPPVAASALVAAVVADTKYWAVCIVITKLSWPMWVFPLLFLVAPELLLLGDTGAAITIIVIVGSAFGIMGVQFATAGWLFRPLLLPSRLVLYANFGLLVAGLRQHSEVLLIACIAVVVGTAIATIVLHGREVERAAAVEASGSGGAGS